ncbi:MAG: OmpA family protein [Sedimentisphaerales bacterium]|nr:OmpA family protein [Sedimentisphaerales bacterium]
MRALKLSVVSIVCACLLLLTGCESPQQKDLRIQNDTQRKRIAELESELQATGLQLEQLKRQLTDAKGKGDVEVDTLQQKIAALEEDLAKKKELIASMQQRLLSGAALPIELSAKLEDFAKANEQLVSFDPNTGIVKFKSDLLFEKGSDKVAPAAAEAVKTLCGILNSAEGKKFDIIIAGHTDDLPILKPDTRAQHPTNWHLSAHRAISVLDVMATNNLDPKRMSIRGFSEYRPVAPNAPNKKGNQQNRRVEIYIVPEGV